MKVVRYFLIALVILILVFLGITAFLPKTYYVERSISIDAPQTLVFSQVVDFESWQKWNPWNDLDEDMKIVYGNQKVGKGASYQWFSSIAGNGEMLITNTEFPSKVEYRLTFEGYEKNPSSSTVTIEENDRFVEVKWSFEGAVGDKFFARWMSVLMDRFVGPNYEEGLKRLKVRTESMAKEMTGVPAPDQAE